MEIKDLEGNVIQVGDRIAGAFRIGNVAVLRTGSVLAFGERANHTTVKVHWDHDSSYAIRTWREGQHDVSVIGEIEADRFRFVRIGG